MKQLTLGELIEKCDGIARRGPHNYGSKSDPVIVHPGVMFDFEYLVPTGIDSWRGIYAELALSFDAETDAMILPSFIKMLKTAVGKTYIGYKGGNYTMGHDTRVWVANPGHSGNTAVVGVIDGGYQVILATAWREV